MNKIILITFAISLLILIARLWFVLLDWAVWTFWYDLQFIQYIAILVIVWVIKSAI